MSVVLRVAGIGGAVALGGIAAASLLLPVGEAGMETGAQPRPASAAFAPLPAVNAQVPGLILDMSPFARDRSAFDRATASTPPPPGVEVKLTGIFRVGKELRASLMINGQSLVVRKGDETEAGKVTKLEPGAVVLSGAAEQRFEMFR